MFGCIVAGRLVQTNLQQVDQTKYVFELHDAKAINHIVVFLTGVPFPQGYGATVHFLWPNPSSAPTWQLLGYLSNEKPSAVFKLGQKHTSSNSFNQSDSMMDDSTGNLLGAGDSPITASLGISVEPIELCLSAVEAAKGGGGGDTSMVTGSEMALNTVSKAGLSGADPQVVGTKLMESLYNYCSSFASNLPPGGNALFGRDWNTTFVPLKAIQDWYQNMQRKFKIDPSGSFLKNN
ncbi:hypothetical protein HDU80_006845 [Chytriomyces hyalinus]|nr:hypothetical protein HDU80_006845 [Chytriomyces hyalinus]